MVHALATLDTTSTELTFTLDDQGRLHVLCDGVEKADDVTAVRNFPWTNPNEHVSIRNRDGDELVHVDDLNDLSRPDRQAIEGWLARNTFIPKIRRVSRLHTASAYMKWEVDTDRGATEFKVQEREDIRRLGDGRHTIRDTSGTVYELPPLETLDTGSRRVLMRVL
ncbi:MAG: DUF1854 domain-containing protein [Planctomycetota bacterium]